MTIYTPHQELWALKEKIREGKATPADVDRYWVLTAAEARRALGMR